MSPRLPLRLSFRLPRRLVLVACACAAVLVPRIVAAQTAAAPRERAIVNVRIVVAPGRVIERGNIVVRDGLIAAVGKDVKVPPGADVIDANGLTAYAGFIDAASSELIDAAKVAKPAPGKKVDFTRAALAATRADNRRGLIPEFRVVDALKLEAAKLDALRKSGFTAVHVLPTGQIAGGQGTFLAAGTPTEREAVLRDATFAQFQLHALRGATYPATLMGATAHLRQALLDARRYRRHRELFRQGGAVPRPLVDQTLDALNDVLDRRRRAVFTVTTADDVRRALSFAAEHKIVPTIWGGKVAFRCIPELKKLNAEVIVDLDFSAEPRTRRGRRFRNRPPQVPTPKQKRVGSESRRRGPDASQRPVPPRVREDRRKEVRAQIAGLAELRRANVRFAVSSRGLKTPGEILSGMRRAIEEGLPRDAGLAALTTDAASLLGMQRRLGTLEVGKLAHIVVMTGPFDDKLSLVRHVLIEGRKFDYNNGAKPLSQVQRPVAARRPQRQKKPKSDELPTELKSDRLASRPFRTGGNVLIKNATVLTGTGKTLRGTSILIRKGKIAAIGRNLNAPAGVRVVDAAGWYAMPGIIDTHSHIMITAGINESTQSIVPEVRVKDVINTDDIREYHALAGGMTAARLLHGSANVIGGQDAVVKLKYGKTAAGHLVPNAPQGVKFALGENVKFRTGRFPNTRLGVEATLKRAFLEAIEYRRNWQDYERKVAALNGKPNRLLPPRRDLRLEALADIVNHKKFIHSHCYRADEILMLLRVASSFGIRVQSLQHVLEGYKIAPEIAAHGASCSTFADWWAYKVEAYDAIPHNAALLHEAGVNVVIKSDNAELMRHLYLGAAKTVRYGNMPPDAALQTITLNPARELGLDKRMGSLEVGKDGDVALFNGHPLNGFSRCEMTIVDGEIYFSRKHAPTAMSPAGIARSSRPDPFRFPSPKVRSRKLDLAAVESGRYAIRNAYLHVVSGPDIPRGTVLIEDGKITAIGKAVTIPSGTKILDGRGLHVSPGFIDAGTTLGLVEIGKVRETHDDAEGGGIQPDLRAGVALNRDSELIPVSRAGGITTILVRPTGGTISGQASIAKLAGWTTPEMIVDLEAGLQINWPRAKPQLDQLTKYLKQARDYDKLRREAATSKRRGPIVDPQLEAMRPYLNRKKPVFIEADSRKAIGDALDFAKKEKLRVVITGGTDAWKVAGKLKKRNVPVIVGPVMRAPTESYDPFDAPYANPGRLYEAGVKFCIRSNNASNSRNAPFEATMAVAYGLPRKEGLRAVTLSAAEILHVADRIGSLTKGKQANLVISDGPPLQQTSQIKGVFIDGHPFPPTSRQTRFYETYRRRLHEQRRSKAPTAGGS
jgi:imidazolonepropionase-like amidohydrolase